MAEPVPVTDVKVATSDLDETLAFINETYVGARARPGSGGPGFHHELNGHASPSLQSARYHYSRGLSLELDPFGYLMSLTVTSGTMTASAGRDLTRGGDAAVFLYPCGRPMQVAWSDDFAAGLLALPLERVAEYATGQTGMARADFTFLAMRPVSAAMAWLWRRTMNFAAAQLAGPDPAAARPLVEEATVAMVAATALTVFPNTVMTTTQPGGRGWMAPAALRRAAVFIDEHAHEPVTLAQIAAAAGVSGRTLQYAFARYYATSPSGYLRRVRLERAHRDLQTADPTRGDTVAAIARAWGWANPSAFAAAYRQQYGRRPGQTLRT
jgi:AraC-like DNA-binding protein